jgi:hypothetical protein
VSTNIITTIIITTTINTITRITSTISITTTIVTTSTTHKRKILVISCTNVTKIKTIEKHLFKTKCKWESKVRVGIEEGEHPEVSWKLEYKMKKWTESRNSNGAAVVVSIEIVIVGSDRQGM